MDPYLENWFSFPSAEQFTDLNSLARRAREIESDTVVISGLEAQLLQFDALLSSSYGYRFSVLAFRSLCNHLGKGLFRLICDLLSSANSGYTPDYESNLLNNHIAKRRDRLESLSLIVNVNSRIIEAVSFNAVRSMNHSQVIDLVDSSIVQTNPQVRMKNASIYSGDLFASFTYDNSTSQVRLSDRDLTYGPGICLSNGSRSGGIRAYPTLFTDIGFSVIPLRQRSHLSRGRGERMESRVINLLSRLSNFMFDSRYIASRFQALDLRSLGASSDLDSTQEKVEQHSRLLKGLGVKTARAKKILQDSLLRGRDDKEFDHSNGTFAQNSVFDSRTLFDLYCSMVREAQPNSEDFVLRKAAYSVLTKDRK